MPKRTLCRWRKAAGTRPLKPGRPPYSAEVLRKARLELTQAMRFLGWETGWKTIRRHLPEMPTWLIQKMLSQIKLEYRRRKRRHQEKHRTSIKVLVKHALLTQDGTHTGRVRGRGASAEVTKDVGTLKTKASGSGRPLTAKEVVGGFKRLKKKRRLPLVWASDNFSPYIAEITEKFLRENQVVHLKSRAHTPQDNPWAEQAIGEGKAEAELGRGRRLGSARRGVRLLQKAYTKINRRPRASKGGRSANELDRVMPHWRTRISRPVFYAAVQRAINKATKGLNGRKARTAERKAIFGVLKRFKLIRVLV
jgi:hypothetical protein